MHELDQLCLFCCVRSVQSKSVQVLIDKCNMYLHYAHELYGTKRV